MATAQRAIVPMTRPGASVPSRSLVTSAPPSPPPSISRPIAKNALPISSGVTRKTNVIPSKHPHPPVAVTALPPSTPAQSATPHPETLGASLRIKASELRAYLSDPSNEWLSLAYLYDWAIFLVLLAVFVFVSIVGRPRQSFPIVPNDPSLSEPFERAAVTPLANLLLSLLLPYLLMWAVLTLHRAFTEKEHFNWHDAHNMTLGFLLALVTQALLVRVLKLVTGQPRPNYFANPDQMRSGLESFPDAQTALAFTSWTYMMMYTSGKLGSFHNASSIPAWKTLVTLAILLPAVLVAISQRLTHQHHWADILTAVLIGAFIASCYYHNLFYALSIDSVSALPKRRTLPTKLSPGPHHHLYPPQPSRRMNSNVSSLAV